MTTTQIQKPKVKLSVSTKLLMIVSVTILIAATMALYFDHGSVKHKLIIGIIGLDAGLLYLGLVIMITITRRKKYPPSKQFFWKRMSFWISLSILTFSFFLIYATMIISAFLVSGAAVSIGGVLREVTIQQPNINFQGLNETDKSLALEMIREIYPPSLLKVQQSITFTTDISKFCNDCTGINIMNGENIQVLWTEGNGVRRPLDEIRTTICHELLHSVMYTDAVTHDILYGLADHACLADPIRGDTNGNTTAVGNINSSTVRLEET